MEGTGYAVVHCDTSKNREAQRSWRCHRKVLSNRVRSEWRSLSESQSHSHQANLLVQILLPRLQTPLQTDLNHKLPALPRKLPQGVLANCQTRLDLDVLKNTLELAIRSEDMCKFLFIKFWTWARHSVARPRSSPSARQKEIPGAKSLDRDLDVRTWPHAHYLVR